MKRTMRLLAATLVAVASGCATTNDVPTDDGSTGKVFGTTNGKGCATDSSIVKYPVDVAPKCARIRTGGNPDHVRAPLLADTLATQCVIKLDLTRHAQNGEVCYANVTPPYNDDDELSVTQWSGQFSLTIRQAGTTTFRTVALEPHTVTNNNVAYVPYLHSDLAEQIIYYVYLENSAATERKIPKVLRIETFDRRAPQWSLCEGHMPVTSPAIVDCPAATGTSGSQTGSSGGGEPPPR